jgi:hypothetical protein
MRIVFSYIIFISFLNAGIFPIDIRPSKKEHIFMGIKILDQKQFVFQNINGVKFSEISDLTYFAKNKKLFMISDEGKLFTFKAKFGNKIELLEPEDAIELKKKNTKKFKKWRKDSEGLTLDNKGRLLISFEGKAKIGWFHKNSSKYGQMIKKYKLPKELRNPKNYRSRNKSLESLAWHPKYGILTVAEWPLEKYNKKRQVIYALNGKKWYFKAEPESKSAVSAIEVMDDGNLLVLERSFSGYLNPFIVTLKKVYLNICKNGICKTEVLLKMNSHKGWSVDNFEGLARISKNRYVMISDDNDVFFQKTLFIYFEVNG